LNQFKNIMNNTWMNESNLKMQRGGVFSMSSTPPSSWVIYLQEMIVTSFCLIWTNSSSPFQATFDLLLHNIFFLFFYLFFFFLLFHWFSLNISSLFCGFLSSPVFFFFFFPSPWYLTNSWNFIAGNGQLGVCLPRINCGK